MKKWWVRIGIALAVLVGVALVVATYLARRFEPFIREQTIAYLSEKLKSDVQLKSLQVSFPITSPLQVALHGGFGATAHVIGEGLSLKFAGAEDLPPMIQIARFDLQVEAVTLWKAPVYVRRVDLEGLQIHVPPKGRRAKAPGAGSAAKSKSVRFGEIRADGARLVILPKEEGKAPLEFDIHRLTLHGTQPGAAFAYNAKLRNAKPPGEIAAQGHFGPWAAEGPGETPLDGEYTFEKADLGVFKGIAGILASTGKFSGQLEEIVVDGEARVPDFRLKKVNNPVPLETVFHAIVDGTNGDTRLEPVHAKLATTTFTVRGGVVRYTGERGKTVALNVKLNQGKIDDMLRLAMRGNKPMLRGGIGLTMQMKVPPGTGEIADRLQIFGDFRLEDARFTSNTVQDKIDGMSRRGQGRPKDMLIDEVPSDLAGKFRLINGRINFDRLHFTIPGAAIALAGAYTFDSEELDFHGKLRLQAKVSQTMTGWKRWVLKPADPFFAKDGAGTQLNIQVVGTRKEPKFGLDKGKKKGSEYEDYSRR